MLGQGGGAAEIRGEYVLRDTPTILTQMVIPPKGDLKLIATSLGGDFPQVDPRRHGLARKLTVIAGGGAPNRPGATSISMQDWSTGKSQTYDFGANYMVEEHLFIPKPGKPAETDAWLVGAAINLRAGRSELWVFDAADIAAGPVAVWQADYSWPLGFHGTWA